MKLTTEQIQKAYIACFGRSADVGGFEYWKQQEFENEAQIYQLFVNSDEGQGIYSGKTDDEIIEIIYQNALGRKVDVDGKNFWLEQWHTQGYGLDDLIQNITQAAINNGELTQSLINNAINETKITQINLASVIALDRPATVQEIKENINKDCYTYNYVKIYSQTIEFMANGGTLNQVLQEKIDFNDLNAELDNAIKSDVPTDHNYFFSKDFQMVKLLISAWEYPKNLNSQIFSNEVLISKETGLDMLKHIDNSSSYVYKLFKYNDGLDLVKQQLKETATELTTLKDLTLIPKYVNIIETLGSKEPQQELTIQYVKFTDNLNDGILNSGDYLTLSFTEKIKPLNIEDLKLSNNHNFGSNATIEPINPDKNGYSTEFKIILGEGVNIASGDIITINKDKVVDTNGKTANENIKLALIDILSQNTAPTAANNDIVFNDTQNDNILNANDSLTITFSEIIDTKNLKISDFILSNHSFGEGAYITPINVDIYGFAKEIKIILGDGVNIVDNDIITIKKDKIIDKGGLSATKDIKFILENIPKNEPPAANSKVKFNDTQNDGLLNQGDTLTISFTEKIKADALKIENISLDNNTHSFGDDAYINPKNIDENGYASEFEIILGENVNLDNNDKLIIDKNSVIDKGGLTPEQDIKLNLTDILPINEPPTFKEIIFIDKNNDNFTNKGDIFTISFNEKINADNLTIDDLIVENGNNFGDGAILNALNPDDNGFTNKFEIVLGKNATILTNDIVIIDKNKVIDEFGLTAEQNIEFNIPTILEHNEPPEANNSIIYTDTNNDNFTNKGDTLTLSFSETIKADFNITDLILNNGHTFGNGAILEPINEIDGYAIEYKIILGENSTITTNDIININRNKIVDKDGLKAAENVKFIVPNLPANNEPPTINPLNAIVFTDVNVDNFTNKTDILTLSFNEPIKVGEFDINDLLLNNGHNFGDGATFEAINEINGYANKFNIILGKNPTVITADIITIDKEKVIDNQGLKAINNIEFIVPTLPNANEPPEINPLEAIKFTDENADEFTNKGDTLTLSFNEPIKVGIFNINDLLLNNGHSFGNGATITTKDTDEYSSEFIIYLGKNPTIEENDKITINKEKVIDNQGLKAAENIEFIVPELKPLNEPPEFENVIYIDVNNDGFNNKGDTLTISFNEKISKNLNIDDLIIDGKTFGVGATITPIITDDTDFTNEFIINLGKNPTIETNDLVTIDKNKIIDKLGLKALENIEFNLPEIKPNNEPPTIAENNSIIYTDINTDNFTNKGDTLTLTFNEPIKSDAFTINDLIIESGNNFGQGAILNIIDNLDGYATKFEIILGKNPTIETDDIIIIDKNKIIDQQGLKAADNAQFIIPELLPINEPPAIADNNSIIYTDVNTDNFTNKGDTLILTFSEKIKADSLTIADFIVESGNNFGENAFINLIDNNGDGYASKFEIVLGKNPSIVENDIINIDKNKIVDKEGLNAAENAKFIIPELFPANEPPEIDPLNSIIFVDENVDNFTNKGDTLTLSFNEPIKVGEFNINDLSLNNGHSFGDGATLNIIDNVDGYATKFEIILGKEPTVETNDIINIDKEKIIDIQGLKAVENPQFIVPTLFPTNEPPTIAENNAIIYTDINTDNFTNKDDTLTLSFNEPIKIDNLTIDDFIVESGNNFGNGAILNVIDNVDGYASKFEIVLGKEPTVETNDIINIDKNKIEDKQGLTAVENAKFIIPELYPANEPPTIDPLNAIVFKDENADNFTNKSDSITLKFNEPIKSNAFTINDLIIESGNNFGDGATLEIINDVNGYTTEFKIILGKNPTVIEDDIISINKNKIIDQQGLNAREDAKFIVPELLPTNEPPTIADNNSIIYTDKNTDNFTNKGDTLTLNFSEKIKIDNITINDLIISDMHSFGDGAILNAIDNGSGFANEFEIILGKEPTIAENDVITINKEKIIDELGLKAAENAEFIIPELLPINEPPTIAPLNAIIFTDKNLDNFTNKSDSLTLTFNEKIKADQISIENLIIESGNSFGNGAFINILDNDGNNYATKFEIILGKNPTIVENDIINIDKNKVIDTQGLKASENVKFIIPELLPINEPPEIDPLNAIVFTDENTDNFTNKGDSITLTFNEPIKANEFIIDDLIVAGGVHNFGDGASLVVIDNNDGYATKFEIILGENATIEENDIINIDKNKVIDKEGLKAAENIEFIIPELLPKNEPPKLDTITPIEYKDTNTDNFTNKGDNLTINFNEPISITDLTLNDLIIESGNDFGNGASLVAIDDDGDGYATEFQVILGKNPTIEENDVININKNKIVDKEGLKAENDIQLIVPPLNPINEPPEFENVNYTDTNSDNFLNKGDTLTISFNEKISKNLNLSDLIVQSGNDFGVGATITPVITDDNDYVTEFTITFGKNASLVENDVIIIDKEKIIDKLGLKAAENIEFIVPELKILNEPPEKSDVPVIFTDENIDNFTNKNDSLTLTFNEKVKISAFSIDDLILNNGHTFGDGANLVALNTDGDYASEFKILLGKNPTIEENDNINIDKEKIIDIQGLKASENIIFIIPELLPINEPPSLTETSPIIYEDINNDNFANEDDILKINFNEPIKIDELTLDDLTITNGHNFGDGASLIAIDDDGDGYAEEFQVILGDKPTIEKDDIINIDKNNIIDIQGLKAAEDIQLIVPEMKPKEIMLNRIEYNDINNDGYKNKDDNLILTFSEKIKVDKLKLDEITIQNPNHHLGTNATLIALNDNGDGLASQFKIILGEEPKIINNDILIIPKENLINYQNTQAIEDIEYTLTNIYPQKVEIISIEKDLTTTSNKYIFTFNELVDINDFITINKISTKEITQITPLNTDSNNYATKFELTIPNLDTVADVANEFSWNNILVPKYNDLIFNLDKETLTTGDNYVVNLKTQENNTDITNIINVNSKNIDNFNLKVDGNNKKEINITTQENLTFRTIESNEISNDYIKLDITGDIYANANNDFINNIYSGLGNDVIEIANGNRTAISDAVKANGVLKFTYTAEEITGGYTDTIKGFNVLDKIILPTNFAVKEFTQDGDLIVYDTTTNIEYTPIHIENYTEAVYTQIGDEVKAFFPNYTNKSIDRTYNLLVHNNTGDNASNGFNIINNGDNNTNINATSLHYNTINSGSGDDSIYIGSNNIINSGNGNDTISARSKNTINSGNGNNKITVSSTYNTINSGNGNDTITLDDFGFSYNEANAGDGDNTIKISGFHNTVNSGNGNDSITIYDYNNTINSGGGDDTISGNASSCKIDAGDGNNVINGKTGNTIISGMGDDKITVTEANTINSGDGADTISATKNNIINSEDGNDNITITLFNNKINGGNGNDTITSSSYGNTINGDSGNDTINISSGSYGNTINGGNDDDTIIINSYNNTINGDNGNDTITSTSYNNIINGGNGNDVIKVNYNGSKTNVATISGGAGNDEIDIKDTYTGADALNTGKTTIKFEATATNNGKDIITNFTPKLELSAYQEYADVLNFSAFLNGANTFTRETNNNITFGSTTGNKVLAIADGADVKIYYNEAIENNLVATLVGVDITKLDVSNFSA